MRWSGHWRIMISIIRVDETAPVRGSTKCNPQDYAR